MADVFVVAIFLAIMSTNHAETSSNEQFSIFGFNISLEISTQTLSAAGEVSMQRTMKLIAASIGLIK